MFNLKNTDEALIYQGRITAVHPKTMTADIYVPEINNQYRNVYLLSSSIQTTYGNISLPEVDSLGLIVLYHRSKQPVIMGFIPSYGFNSGGQTFEYLNPGESQVSAKGGGYFKCDISGNSFVGNSALSADIHLPDGEKLEMSMGKSEISNFHRNDLHIDYNSDIITVDKNFEYIESLDVKTVSVKDVYDGKKFNRELAKSVLDEAENIISSLSGDESPFFLTEMISNSIFNHTAAESDIEEYSEKLSKFVLKGSGRKATGELFSEKAFSFNIEDEAGNVTGIEIDESGGKLVGRWDISD